MKALILRPELAQFSDHVQEQVVVLDRYQAPNDADGYLVIGHAIHLAEQLALAFLVGLEAAQVETEGDHAHLVGRADAVFFHQFLLLLVTYGDDAAGACGEEALDVLVQRRAHRAEVAVEHVAVEGVHNGLYPQISGRHTPHGTGLGRMGVHDIGLELAYQLLDSAVGTPVAPGGHFALQFG
jgi:hypothetical protein